MLVNNPPPHGGHRHDYIRLFYVIGAFLLFIGYIYVQETCENIHGHPRANATWRPEDRYFSDIRPTQWTYGFLRTVNYLWQLGWLLYSLTLIYRLTSSGYLYLSPNTLTPTFYIIYIVAFCLQSIWILWFQEQYFVWTWIIYLISFLLLSLALFIVNNNLAVNRKFYETEGYVRDIWLFRFLVQNGIAFFACWTAVRFVLAFDTFLQLRLGLTILNAGTIALILAGIIAAVFFFAPNFNATYVDQCAYQFAPWIVFIVFFWGVVQRNWIDKHQTRNNIISLIELIACILSGLVALGLFYMRYRSAKIDTIA